MVQHCLIINLDNRTDLWKNLEHFRTEWITQGKIVERISGVDYRNKKKRPKFWDAFFVLSRC